MVYSRVITNNIRSLLFLWFLAFVAITARADLQFDVFPGYDSMAREAQWCPVSFEVKNDGPTFSGFIEFSTSQMSRNHARVVPIELPTGTLKRVTIPVFSSSRYGAWQARLLNERGKVVAEQEIPWQRVKKKSGNTVLMGALSRAASGVPIFPAIKRNEEAFQPAAARIQPALFPDNPITLDGLQCIYLNSERALDLKVGQVQALTGWLLGGGHLIVGVEQVSDVNGTPWLRELLPCEFTSATQVKAANVFQDWLRQGDPGTADEEDTATAGRRRTRTATETTLWKAGGTNIINDSVFEQSSIAIGIATVRDGRILAAAEGKPLAIESSRGLGKITVLTFSPERQPFVGWHNRPWFWAMVGNVSPTLYDSSDFNQWGWSADGVFGSMIDSKQIRKLPLGWLVLLLIIYLLVIGPVDQYWLKKINRQMLTWVTFPCYVILFSALIYFIGFQLRAGDTEWNELHVVDILPNGEKAILRGRTYASIYSPANQRYTLKGEQFMASLRGEYLANWGNGEESSQATVTFNGNKYNADVFVPVWTSQLYVNDWWQPTPAAPLTATVEGTKLKIANRHSSRMTHVRVCVDGKVHDVGELAPNNEILFALDSAKGVPLRDFVRSQGGSFFPAVEARRQTFGGDESRYSYDLPAASVAACFLSQLDESNNYRNFISPAGLDLTAATSEIIVLAWVPNEILTKPLNDFTARRSSKNSLLRLVIPRTSTTSQLSLVN